MDLPDLIQYKPGRCNTTRPLDLAQAALLRLAGLRLAGLRLAGRIAGGAVCGYAIIDKINQHGLSFDTAILVYGDPNVVQYVERIEDDEERGMPLDICPAHCCCASDSVRAPARIGRSLL